MDLGRFVLESNPLLGQLFLDGLPMSCQFRTFHFERVAGLTVESIEPRLHVSFEFLTSRCQRTLLAIKILGSLVQLAFSLGKL